MNKTLFIALSLILILTEACAPNENKEEAVITQSVPTTATPIYISGQVEWIAKSFSPECRIKKTNPATGGG